MPLDMTPQTCQTCRHHGPAKPDFPGHGDCRVTPPERPTLVGLMHTYIYRVTADDLPACGLYRALDEGRKPVLETKVGVARDDLIDVSAIPTGAGPIGGTGNTPGGSAAGGVDPDRGHGSNHKRDRRR